ncbi:methyltransferase family protein [Candidatus Neomarinimicrobiota bacterium]
MMVVNYVVVYLLLLLGGYVLFRIYVRNKYIKKGKLSPLTSFLEFLFFALHANSMYVFIPVRWPYLPQLSDNQILYYISLFLIITGLLIVLSSIIPLGYNRSMGLKSKTLKTDGLYKFSRNPQLSGYGILLIGFAVSYPSIYIAGWIIVYAIVSYMMAITEEEYLLEIYGEDYKQYCIQVPRFIKIR